MASPLIPTTVDSRAYKAPISNPTRQSKLIIAATAVGLWEGKDHHIATWTGSSWKFIKPIQGVSTWIVDEGVEATWDGSAWVVPSGGSGGGESREILHADRIYYVRTDGNDSNTGLVNDASGAFLTIQKAVNVVSLDIDMNIFQVTIKVADGTYNTSGTNLLLGEYVGNWKPPIIEGNITTPSNCIISNTSSPLVNCMRSQWTIRGFRVIANGSLALFAQLGAYLTISDISFGYAHDQHMWARSSVIQIIGNYSIDGPAIHHIIAEDGGYVGTMGYSIAVFIASAYTISIMAYAINGSTIRLKPATFTGAQPVGIRYVGEALSVIIANNAIPGTVGGNVTGGSVKL